MVVKDYGFGPVVIRVSSPVQWMADSRFEAFELPAQASVDFYLDITTSGNEVPGRLDNEKGSRECARRLSMCLEESQIPRVTLGMMLSGSGMYRLLPEKGCYILHCSFVLINGKALLFSAPSETGKSTQAAFWKKHRGAEIINEDRALLYRQGDQWCASGVWATGLSNTCRNAAAPIKAVVLLGQGKENQVYHPRPSEALSRLLPQCSFSGDDPRQCRQIISLVSSLIESTPMLGFDCINDSSAVEELEKYL